MAFMRARSTRPSVVGTPAPGVEGGAMDDLTGSPTERLAQLRAADAGQDAAWLERQLTSALEEWQAAEDALSELREAREDF